VAESLAMAELHDVGAHCAAAGCGRQDFLPFTCDACGRKFCQDHFRREAHDCSAPQAVRPQAAAAAAAAAAPPVDLPRCAAKGCKEQLFAHNRFHCERCGQHVCIRHRFEDDHPCVSVEVAVGAALRHAQSEMAPSDFQNAHSTLLKVFNNILSEPGNEKYRSLKKSNAVVKEKLCHPACIEALRLCGFSDTGEAYVCRQAADLSVMRRMSSALRASSLQSSQKGLAAAGPAPVSTGSAGGRRIVNGVIVDAPQPPLEERPPLAAPSAVKAATEAGSYAEVPAPESADRARAAAKAGTAKAKATAFDFKRRGDREAQEQAQIASLQELRRQQKERYKAGGSAGTSTTPATSTAASASTAPTQGQDQCALQ